MRVSAEIARKLGAKGALRKSAHRVLAPKSELVATLQLHLRAAGLPAPADEVRVVAGRGWRFDLAYPDLGIAIECDGGTWSRGRHTRGPGFEEDCRKLNRGALAGWTVLRFTMPMIHDGTALDHVRRAMMIKGWHPSLLPLSGDTAPYPSEGVLAVPQADLSGSARTTQEPPRPVGVPGEGEEPERAPWRGHCAARDPHGSACDLERGHGGSHHSTSGMFN